MSEAPRRPRSGFGYGKRPAQPVEVVPGLSVRLAAAAVLAEVVGNGLSLDERFAPGAGPEALGGLDARDRALVRSIVLVALRRLGTLRAALAATLEKGLPRKAQVLEWTLLTGAAQILYMDVPDHAAVDLAVRAARRDARTAPFAALVNAVLRNIARRRDELATVDDAFIDTPQWLSTRWRKAYGGEVAARIALAHRDEPTLDVTLKPGLAADARPEGVLLPTGSLRLTSHDPVAELEGYGEGHWWVQDAAAALPARLLNVQPGERVADLCAAPGGKTAQLASAGALVVALDRSAERLKRLTANLERLGLSAEIKVGDVLGFDAPAFDAILLDAPCSATGTIRRHPDVAWTKKAGDVATLAAVQSKMLDRAASLLKPGGRLVYCTCSLEPEEGEQQIAQLLRRNPDLARDPVRAEEIGGLSACITPEGDLRTLPFHLSGDSPRLSGLDGFFAARLVRGSKRL
ncbi:MAG: Sun protein [Hyphomicrobiales bacterium]|nr:Sun protein [Hyphomicrobiales bacterium]